MNAPVVVKLGSNLVVDEERRPRWELVNGVAAEVAATVRDGTPVVIVSSGAIALGSAIAGLQSGRRKLGPLQAASALGQAELQRVWHEAFAPLALPVAQVLLTPVEITERRSYLNVGNALRALFDVPAVPILNENDATATDEISFGDNDVLAAQVAVLLRAARLFLLTSADGVMSHPPGVPGATVVADGAELGAAVLGPSTSLRRGRHREQDPRLGARCRRRRRNRDRLSACARPIAPRRARRNEIRPRLDGRIGVQALASVRKGDRLAGPRRCGRRQGDHRAGQQPARRRHHLMDA